MREEYYDQREALHAIKKTDDTRRPDELATLRAQVAQLTAERDEAVKLAEDAEQRRVDSGVVARKYASHAEAAERSLDGCRDLIATLRTRIAEAEQENARLREAVGKWVASYRDTLRERMAADRRRDDHGAYAANETVLADLDTLAALLAQPESASRCMPRPSTGHPDTPVEHRCNICGGVVHFDGTPPVKGNWPAKSRALRAQPEGGPATETCR